MSDKIVSIIRTAAPTIWGSLVAQLIIWFPGLPQGVNDWLLDQTAAVTAVSIVAFYAAWRYIEPLVPDWLSRIFMGSAQMPIYPEHIEQPYEPEHMLLQEPEYRTRSEV